MNYQLNSYVNRQEAETLKEIIFKRVRERSESMTDDVKSDVMDIARESFVSKNNPFSQILTQTAEASAQKTEEKKEVKTSALHEFVDAVEAEAQKAEEQIGFPQKAFFAGTVYQNKIIKEQVAAAQVNNMMREAREGLTNKKSFMGALEFLNSQAASSLLNKRSNGVDIVV